MFDDPLEFTGPDDVVPGADYRIGVFSPLTGSRSLMEGAQLAADQINDSIRLDKPLRLIQRWADDPWKAGSQQVIKLVYQDSVLALIGGPDSASTHVAQQVALKAHVPLLSPVATDPTLTEIRVPWIFRLPPNDDALAKALVKTERNILGLRIGMLYLDQHDARMAAAAFKKALQTKNRAPVFEMTVPDSINALVGASRRAKQFEPDVVWVWFDQKRMSQLVELVNERDVCNQVITQWNVEHSATPLIQSRTSILYAAPFDLNGQINDTSEVTNYRDAYCYDAVNLIAAAIQQGGVTRKRLREQISRLSGYQGVTGNYVWDTGGGNTAPPVVVTSATNESHLINTNRFGR